VGLLVPELMQPATWLQRWGGASVSSLLDRESQRLVPELHRAVSEYVTQGFEQLRRLVSPTPTPVLAKGLMEFEQAVEKCYAVALQALQGMARIVHYSGREELSDDEKALLCESGGNIIEHAEWAQALPEHFDQAKCKLDGYLRVAISGPEEAVCAEILNHLKDGLDALWTLVREKRAQISTQEAEAQWRAEEESFVKLYLAIDDCGVLGMDVVRARSRVYDEDEKVVAVVALEAIFNQYVKLLSEKRNLDLVGKKVDQSARCLQRRRVDRCFMDFLFECKNLVKLLNHFGAKPEAVEEVRRNLDGIAFYMERMNRNSIKLVQRLINASPQTLSDEEHVLM